MSRPVWRRSRSGAEASGVEVALVEGVVTVRDAAEPYRAVLVFGPQQWAAFTERVRAGECDVDALATRSAGDGSGVDAPGSAQKAATAGVGVKNE